MMLTMLTMLRSTLAAAALLAALFTTQALAQGTSTPVAPATPGSQTVFSAVTLDVSTSSTSVVLPWGSKTGMEVVITTSANASTCSFLPVLTINGDTAIAGTTYQLPVRNSLFTFPDAAVAIFAYEVQSLANFVQFALTSTASASGATACTTTVFVIPRPWIEDAADYTFTGSLISAVGWGVVSVGTTATAVGAAVRHTTRAITVQNQSTVVIFCAPRVGGLSTTQYGHTLSAGAVAADGTGGAWTFTPVTGPIFCLVTTGTANVSFTQF